MITTQQAVKWLNLVSQEGLPSMSVDFSDAVQETLQLAADYIDTITDPVQYEFEKSQLLSAANLIYPPRTGGSAWADDGGIITRE